MRKDWLYIIPIAMIIVGCGSTNDSEEKVEGEGSIDMRSYFPFESTTKNYQIISKKANTPLSNDYFTEDITVTDSKIETKILDVTDSIMTIQDKKLIYTDVSDEGNIDKTLYRYIDVDDSLYSMDINSTEILTVGTQEVGTRERIGRESCTLVEELSEFTKGSNIYTGNIVKIKCTETTTITTKVKDEFLGTEGISYVNGTEDSVDISYRYQKNGVGLIAFINDDCIPENMVYPDDTIECQEDTKRYSYIYYLGN
ncbi:MAG TPA: hypothetical protein ENK88_05490 [Campylobacterales bacterium]|nr:hypothetical protein [Campylobacterales bacterium]